eukprot:CAMPEP_0174241376 /NCGR_PEP_ID=MMETSP0417-20130205/23131_1 /TAXON_ID=242541 /ORGANISM="Mayorella sp, Strain BSH-02190019" /LENGTH=90 /DNA_ID=CAMNT_0015320603 /DNA_START=236 /DNA_END=508 /DNA_ORIENTATION=+
MQSGTHKYKQWMLDFVRESTWSNPLMGWTSTRDPTTNLHLAFDTKEEAIAYAERNGLKYEVDPDVTDRPVPQKDYGKNFKFVPKENEEVF